MAGTRVQVGLTIMLSGKSPILAETTYLTVIPGPLVFVLDQQTNWSTKRDSVLDTRLELNKILLITRSGKVTLTRAATTQLSLNILRFEGQTLMKEKMIKTEKREIYCKKQLTGGQPSMIAPTEAQ